jgi:hypothetical protein
VQVLFFQPTGAESNWAKSDLWRHAEVLPHATVRADEAGLEAALFGATTSGHALLFAPDGRLLFSGGLTSARGHAGPSAGGDALAMILRHQLPAVTETPVFGCPLANACPLCKQEDP